MPLIRPIIALLCACGASYAASAPHRMAIPVFFEPNLGQAGRSAAFIARGPGYTTVLRQNGSAVYHFSAAGHQGSLAIDLRGARTHPAAAGEDPLSSVTRFYRGTDPKLWRTEIPAYRNVRLRNVYPGIDMIWQSRGPDLEYEFSVDPDADPRSIQLRFRGARRVRIDNAGNLAVETLAGELRHRRPAAWQEEEGIRRPVNARFILDHGTVKFQLGPYDRSRRLWIDPVLSYSSYLGGGGYDAGYAIAVDGAGQSYVTGTTASLSFPSASSGVAPSRDAFVTKFNADGSIAYTTILGSSGDDYGQAIALDSKGNVYVAGFTQGSNFPATVGAWQTVSGGGEDAFVAKLDTTGHVVFASYIGAAGTDVATGIAVDQSGSTYITGYTSSVRFPTTPGAPQPVYSGGAFDAFLVKLNAAGSAAVYATLLGGTGNDLASAIVLDPAGNACVAGFTDSTDLPVQAALQPAPGGGGDALIACLNPAGSAWTTVSYLGGSGRDEAYALGIDGARNLYVAGATFSQDFPTTWNAFATSKSGSYDAFAAKLAPGGAGLIYATLLGGSGSDAATALAVGGAGDAWVAGYTASMNLPLAGAWQSFPNGGLDGFAAHLSADGTTLLASSYMGGSGDDQIWGIALGPAGYLFATGSTGSTDFPVTPGAAQSTAPGGYNAFVAQIDPPPSCSIAGQVSVSGMVPLGGVSVTLTGSVNGSVTTDASGKYGFSGLPAGSGYTITAASQGYNFSPANYGFANLNTDQSANFTATCPVSLNPAAIFLDAAGQPGPPIPVATNSPACVWPVSTNAGFINITSGISGAGNGAVTFSVPPNNTGADLTGTLAIADQAVSITQRETAVTFTDVNDPSAFFFNAANVMYGSGITNGCLSTPFMYCPNNPVTRGQMAVFLVRSVMGGDNFTYSGIPYFTDTPPGYPFFKWIQKLKELGITNGCSPTLYCPDTSVTRAQMAAFIIRARYGKVPYSYPATPYFSDVPASDFFFPVIQKMAQAGITHGCGVGLYCPDATLTRGQMAVFVVTGLLNQLLASSTPAITKALPNSATTGQVITVTLSGVNTHFAQGVSQVVTTPGVTASNVNVSGPASLTVQLAVNSNAAQGPSSIVVTTGSEEAVLPNGFVVQ